MKISTKTATRINQTKKEFIFFNVENNEITSIKFSNDYIRYKNQYQKYRVISTIKNELQFFNI